MVGSSLVLFNIIRFIFASQFLLYLVYFLLVHVGKIDDSLVTFIKKDPIRLYYILFTFIFSYEVARGLYLFIKARPSKSTLIKQSVGLLGVFGLGVGFLYQISAGVPIWGDELYQYAMSLSSPLEAASRQHQMPLSYMQSHLAYLLFDYNHFSIRFFTYFSFIGFLVLVFKFCFNITGGNKKVALLVSIFCFLSEYLIYHSLDARPQALGLVYFLLLMGQIFCKTAESNKGSFLSTFVLSFIFLNSVGFQPLFLSLSVFIFAFLFFCKRGFKAQLQVASAYLLSLVCYLPLQFYIKAISPPRFKGESGFLQILIDNLSHLQMPDLNQLKILNYSFYPFVIFLSLLLAWRGFLADKNERRKVLFIFGCLVSFLVFNFISFNVYNNTIKWHYKYRYATLSLPLFYIFYTLALSFIFNSSHLISKFKLIKRTSFLLVCLWSLNLGSYFKHSSTLPWHSYDSYSIFEIVKEQLSPGSTLFCLGGKWDRVHRHCSGIIMANEVLNVEKNIYKKSLLPYKVFPRFSDHWIESLADVKGHQFAFLIKSDEETIARIAHSFEFSDYEIIRGPSFVMIKISELGPDELREHIKELLVQVQLVLKKNSIQYFPGFDEVVSQLKAQ